MRGEALRDDRDQQGPDRPTDSIRSTYWFILISGRHEQFIAVRHILAAWKNLWAVQEASFRVPHRSCYPGRCETRFHP